eukprot:5533653-Prymnesium_polylepis.1
MAAADPDAVTSVERLQQLVGSTCVPPSRFQTHNPSPSDKQPHPTPPRAHRTFSNFCSRMEVVLATHGVAMPVLDALRCLLRGNSLVWQVRAPSPHHHTDTPVRTVSRLAAKLTTHAPHARDPPRTRPSLHARAPHARAIPQKNRGDSGESNPGPLLPESRIIPLDHYPG